MKDISQLEKKLKINFKNKELLLQALVHRSYLNENPRFKLGHNERLEFLGDAVLELIVTEYLYQKYSNPEGELTNWRASLVNSLTLSEIAKSLDIDSFILLSKGEARDSNSKARQTILANALEAIVGAIYLDQRYKATQKFVVENLLVKLPHILKYHLYLDPKSQFQEMAQDKLGITPTYKVIEEYGPDHNKHFRVGVFLGEDIITEGEGSSKQEAQTRAAEKALKIKGW